MQSINVTEEMSQKETCVGVDVRACLPVSLPGTATASTCGNVRKAKSRKHSFKLDTYPK